MDQEDFVPPAYPPRLLTFDQVQFLADQGWLPLELSDSVRSACQDVLEETKSFFALDADVKEKLYPPRWGTECGYYVVPEEKEYLTLRYRTNAESSLDSATANAWAKASRLLHRILCDLACFLNYDPRMWDPFLEDTFDLPEDEQSMADTSSLVRLFQYYSKGNAEPHVDLGLITLCMGTDSGLQLSTLDGESRRWITTDSPVVLLGTTATMLLRETVRAGRHRVVSSDRGRRSLVFTLRPCLRAELDLSVFGGEGTITMREYMEKTKASRYNINAKIDLREKQRQKQAAKQNTRLDESGVEDIVRAIG